MSVNNEEESKSKKLQLAYRRVFGTNRKRNESQRLVWEDMQARWRINKPIFIANTEIVNSGDAIKNVVTYDPIKAALTDGARLPILQIEAFTTVREIPAKKPQVKRK